MQDLPIIDAEFEDIEVPTYVRRVVVKQEKTTKPKTKSKANKQIQRQVVKRQPELISQPVDFIQMLEASIDQSANLLLGEMMRVLNDYNRR